MTDPELAVIEILRTAVTHPVRTRLPADVTYPAVRVQALGGSTLVRRWLDSALVQVSVHGPSDAKAALRMLVDEVRDVLEQTDNYLTSNAVVTSVETAPPTWLPDDQPDLSSYTLTATVVIHPLPE